MRRWDHMFNRRKRRMENLDQDIRDFIARETQDNMEHGMPPDEARYAGWRRPMPFEVCGREAKFVGR